MGGGDSVTLPGNMSNTAAAPSLAQSTYRGNVRKALSAMGMGRNGSAGAGTLQATPGKWGKECKQEALRLGTKTWMLGLG